MTDPFSPMSFIRGPAMKNRLMLAPLTNLQSHPDGRMSDDEFHWLTMRAKGGFGLTMTCAANVSRRGQGFPGQMGIWSDDHLEGLTRLASAIKAQGSVAVCQLHHAGMRSPEAIIGGKPDCPSDNAETGAVGLSLEGVERVRDDFIEAAIRAEKAGFDGVELHGAHGYLLCQFLSADINERTDRYGGSFENRARIIDEIIAGIRSRCRPDFNLGIRLSPERFGMRMAEVLGFAERLMTSGDLDYLDMSLWDAFKEPVEEAYKSKPLIEWFTALPRGDCRIGCAGKIMSVSDVHRCLEAGMDYVLLGRAAILHHDWPKLAAADPSFRPIATPVTAEHLRKEGLGPAFVGYMKTWAGFVAQEETV